MKKTLLASLLLAFTAIGSAFAVGESDLEVSRLSRDERTQVVIGTETVALRIRYSGTQASAEFSVGNTSMSFYAPAGTLDTTIGNTVAGSIDITVSTSDTNGELCDYINNGYAQNTHEWQCFLEAGKRIDSTDFLRRRGLFLLAREGNGVNVLVASGPRAGAIVGAGGSIWVGLGITPSTGKRVVLKKCNWNSGVAAGSVTVSGQLARYEGVLDGLTRNDSTTVFGWPTPASVNMVTNFEIAQSTNVLVPLAEGRLRFAKDAHVVVRANDNYITGTQVGTVQSVVADDILNKLGCSWYEE